MDTTTEGNCRCTTTEGVIRKIWFEEKTQGLTYR